MGSYRIDNGFTFDRANLAGIDADIKRGLVAHMARREREINTIDTETLICSGGPFDGQSMEMTAQTSGGNGTAVITIGKWVGHYARHSHEKDGKTYQCAAWFGTNQTATVTGYLPPAKTKATRVKTAPTLSGGFSKLGDFLGMLSATPNTVEHAGQVFAVFKIGRTAYRVLNTPAAIERLRANVIKGKKWFADKLIQEPRKQQPLELIHAQAAHDVAQVLAIAQKKAFIETAQAQNSETETEHDDSRELATVDVCEADQANAEGATCNASNTTASAASGNGSAAAAQVSTCTTGQTINSKSGAWNARFYTGTDGRPVMAFKEATGAGGEWPFETGRERMQALQVMARNADQAQASSSSAADTPGSSGSAATDTPQAAGDSATDYTASREFLNPPEVVEAFKQVGPVRVDLAAMIVKGLAPEALIGLGVYCKGDMVNPSGSGAITGFSHSNFYGLVVDVTLESGQVWRVVRTSEFLNGWFSLDTKIHGMPYLAQLAAVVASLKASASAAKEQAQNTRAKALVDLAAQYPQLKRAESSYAGGKLAAVNIRILLKAAFKGVKFSVTSDYNKVSINWEDGPTDAQVNEVTGRFDIGASDTQSDYFYTVSTAFSDLFGGVQYMHTRRHESDALIQQAIDKLYSNRIEAKPTVQDWRKGCGVFNDYQGITRELRKTLNSISTTQAAA